MAEALVRRRRPGVFGRRWRHRPPASSGREAPPTVTWLSPRPPATLS